MVVVKPPERAGGRTAVMMSDDLRERLDQLRLAAGISRRQLGFRLDLDPSGITKIAGGKSDPSVEKLEAWVAACGAEIVLLRSGAAPRARPVLEAAGDLSDSDLECLTRIARAMATRGTDADKGSLTRAFELLPPR